MDNKSLGVICCLPPYNTPEVCSCAEGGLQCAMCCPCKPCGYKRWVDMTSRPIEYNPTTFETCLYTNCHEPAVQRFANIFLCLRHASEYDAYRHSLQRHQYISDLSQMAYEFQEYEETAKDLRSLKQDLS